MEFCDSVWVLPVAGDEGKLCDCRNAEGWSHKAGAALRRDPYVYDVEGIAKHPIIVSAISLDVESDVVVVIGSDDVIIDMNPCNVCVRIGLCRILC